MKILLFMLLSFSALSQDTCDQTRQQIRLRHDLDKYAIKMYDEQHKRNNSKEIKSLRLDKQSFRRHIRFNTDSLKRSNALLLRVERNRNDEAIKSLRNELIALKAESAARKIELKTSRAEVRTKNIYALSFLIAMVISVILLIIRFLKR